MASEHGQESLSDEIIVLTLSKLLKSELDFSCYIEKIEQLVTDGDLSNWSKLKDTISIVEGVDDETD